MSCGSSSTDWPPGGTANGALEWWYDGVQVQSITNVIWKEASAAPEAGWNTVWLGGNSDNSFGRHTEQWYAFDDVVISTTPIPVLRHRRRRR